MPDCTWHADQDVAALHRNELCRCADVLSHAVHTDDSRHHSMPDSMLDTSIAVGRTDEHFAALTRHQPSRRATFDQGLASLHVEFAGVRES